MYSIKELYDLSYTTAGDYLTSFTYPWEALKGIGELIRQLGNRLDADEYTMISDDVWVQS